MSSCGEESSGDSSSSGFSRMDPDQTMLFLFFDASWGKDPDRFRPLRALGLVEGERIAALLEGVPLPVISIIGSDSERFRPFRPFGEDVGGIWSSLVPDPSQSIASFVGSNKELDLARPPLWLNTGTASTSPKEADRSRCLIRPVLPPPPTSASFKNTFIKGTVSRGMVSVQTCNTQEFAATVVWCMRR